LARYSETKSGGGISTVLFMVVVMTSVLVTTQIGCHRGHDRAEISSLWKTGSLPSLVPFFRVTSAS
jgi:hypothetical protein